MTILVESAGAGLHAVIAVSAGLNLLDYPKHAASMNMQPGQKSPTLQHPSIKQCSVLNSAIGLPAATVMLYQPQLLAQHYGSSNTAWDS